MPSISIVIPAYNEAQRLPASLDGVLAYLASAGWTQYEVIVVDDGSVDSTPHLVEDYVQAHPAVKLLRNPGNRGKGYAVRHGMLEAQADWVLFTDADLSAPIAELSKLSTAAAEARAAVAIGSRALDRSLIEVHQSGFREFAGRLFNLLVQLLAGLRLWDTQCGFKLFRRDAARAVFSRARLNGFGFDVEALFLARRLGFPIVEVPVRWSHVEGTKVRMGRDSLGMFLDVVKVRWYQFRGHYR